VECWCVFVLANADFELDTLLVGENCPFELGVGLRRMPLMTPNTFFFSFVVLVEWPLVSRSDSSEPVVLPLLRQAFLPNIFPLVVDDSYPLPALPRLGTSIVEISSGTAGGTAVYAGVGYGNGTAGRVKCGSR
jgi:hypothetical protein